MTNVPLLRPVEEGLEAGKAFERALKESRKVTPAKMDKVKKVRVATGVSVGDAMRALDENGWDVACATDWARARIVRMR